MTIYIVDIEPVPTRYTAEWKEYLKPQLERATNSPVIIISGGETPQTTTPGAFLNFGGTNVYKAVQIQQISTMICNGEIKDGDYFLYTDAWNPTVIQLKYMASLLSIDIRIGGLWHAGSYDPQDFLGRLIGDHPWVRSAEHSMFSCYDDNFFATNFHIDMFAEGVCGWDLLVDDSITKANGTVKQVGWPMEYLPKQFEQYANTTKEDIILFPHRLAPEKQLDIFMDLSKSLPQFKWVVAQEEILTKDEYRSLVGKSKMIFSANLQETLGISWYEGALAYATPLVPDRLSYSEMAKDTPDVLYPSEWTENWDSYLKNKHLLIEKICDIMALSATDRTALCSSVATNLEKWFNGSELYDAIKQD